MTRRPPDPTIAATAGAVRRDAPLGGFFGLEPRASALPSTGQSLAATWDVEATPHAWTNATSALAALVAHLRPRQVWLPGYLCAWTLAAVPARMRRFFPLRHDLSPDDVLLAGRLSPGDVVLAVDMFGRAPGEDWRAFVTAHPKVTFVEDRAQALDPATRPWGDWLLFSPRKLVGVHEGGLLAAASDRARGQAADLPGPAETMDSAGALDRLGPALARFERPEANDAWHPMHQASEARQAVSGQAMSRLARTLLAQQDAAALVASRRRNFRHLAARLERHALLPEADPAFAPFGFPVVLPPEDRDRVRHRLHERRIFPAVHWLDLAAPASFLADHARSRSLLTLPCDHRYGLADMDRLASAFVEASA